ncbi:hypothetical protein K435DRAFT_859260 [Dendrothele bispora CBS 962.96]|uniref:Ubiquitin-like domain-containing protein n=1 Tax=Dendrothele bispora (strain CBS 962.96) TaxID=1314807 RepID=A0A4S8M113_DENBC|nr:hypothetical protein K435DRAFT_859260 [Dendrothele bispora CBS 962.96]
MTSQRSLLRFLRFYTTPKKPEPRGYVPKYTQVLVLQPIALCRFGILRWFFSVLSALLWPILIIFVTPSNVLKHVVELFCSQKDSLTLALPILYASMTLSTFTILNIFSPSFFELNKLFQFRRLRYRRYHWSQIRLRHLRRMVRNEPMTIFISGVGQRAIPLNVKGDTTISDVWEELVARWALPHSPWPLSSQRYTIHHSGHRANLQSNQTMAQIGVGSLSHLIIRVHILGGTHISGQATRSAVNQDGSLKDASEIRWYNSAEDDSDNPIAGTSTSTSRSKCKVDRSHMKAIIAAEQDTDIDEPHKPKRKTRQRNKSKLESNMDNDSGGEYTDGEESDESDDSELASSLSSKTIPEGSKRKSAKSKGKQPGRVQCWHSPSIDERKRALNDNGEKDIDFKMPSQSEVQNHRRRTSNPIYLFYEQVPLNADGQSGAPGDKHYKCYHGKRKIITVKKTMKSCVTIALFCYVQAV